MYVHHQKHDEYVSIGVQIDHERERIARQTYHYGAAD